MHKVVFCDFDGTISKEDSTDLVLGRFSINDNWLAAEEAWQDGHIGSRDCLTDQFVGVRTTQPEISTLAHELHLEPGFKEFVRFCEENRIPLYIVSDGIDTIIKTFLHLYNLDATEIYANDIQFLPNGEVRFICADQDSVYKCTHDLPCANCKAGAVKYLMEKHNIKPEDAIYIGDGMSDILAAVECGTIFAREKLYSLLKQRNVMSKKFSSFFDIIQSL
jgi:2-hydroxy-3-keto-5-methylthiopentenyl-1-phosphate phosphatase